MLNTLKVKEVPYLNSFRLCKDSFLPNDLGSADYSAFQETLLTTPLVGIELEYDCSSHSTKVAIKRAISRAARYANLPYLYCEDSSLNYSDSFECNLAPATFMQVLKFFSKLFTLEYIEATKECIHSETGMHIHFSHNYYMDWNSLYQYGMSKNEYASWFKSLDSIMLFACLANSENINLPLTSYYGRYFDSYSSPVTSLLKEKVIYEESDFSLDNEEVFKNESVEFYRSTFYRFMRIFMGSGLSRFRESTVEWRPFKTPLTLDDAINAIAISLVFIKFSNDNTESLKEPMKSITDIFERYVKTRLPKYRRLVKSMMQTA